VPRLPHALPRYLLLYALALAIPAHACVSIPAPPTLELKAMYGDSRSSVFIAANEAANGQTLSPIYSFFSTTEKALDSGNARPGNPDSDCAFQLFNAWARAGALTFEPAAYEGTGKVKRGLLNPGFQMIGLKFRAAGYVLDDTALAWLRRMDEENVTFYTRGTNRANQRVWAATGAALNALLQRDAAALAFQDQVWHEAIAAIGQNGFIPAELTRGQQALVYHLYSLSATLVLEKAREALGYPVTAADQAALARLTSAIGKSLCDPSQIEQLAQAKMVIPQEQWAYPVPNAFLDSSTDAVDSANANWSRCTPPPTNFDARDMGGDTRRSVQVLKSLQR
jgi:poly(beta-D-mannuronate) lyase